MAVVRRRGGKFELRVKNRLLPRGIHTATFEDETEAANYGHQLEALLAQGLVPQDLMAERSRGPVPTLARIIGEYLKSPGVSALDIEILNFLRGQKTFASTRSTEVTYPWVEAWVSALKLQHNLAPGTIRKRVGAVARMLDWHLRRTTPPGGQQLANPLRLLPRGYATYNDHERKLLAGVEDKAVRVDVERQRRLLPGEEDRIVAALRGQKRDDRERALQLPHGEALLELYQLIVNTGLRLREAYRLRAVDVDLEHRVLRVGDSKTGEGRDVPMTREIHALMQRRRAAAIASGGLQHAVFPWWNGTEDQKELKAISSYLSRAFIRAFDYAQCPGLTEHDLRHEATCRWILMRDKEGGWLFRTEEVMRITGHKDHRTFMIYVSLRGSDLAAKLW